MALQQARTSEAPKLNDFKPVRKKDDIPQTAPHPVHDKNAAKGSTKDPTDPQHEDETKHSVIGSNTSLQEAGRTSSGSSTIIKRRKPRNHRYETLEKDIIVPPFNDWEKNPESADKYTGVFQIISDSRKTPGTPIKISVEPETKQDTGGKGCRCFSCLFQ